MGELFRRFWLPLTLSEQLHSTIRRTLLQYRAQLRWRILPRRPLPSARRQHRYP